MREKYIQKPTNRRALCLSICEISDFLSISYIFLCPFIPNLDSHCLNVCRFKWTSCARRLTLNIHTRDITKHPTQIIQCIASGLSNFAPKNVSTSPYNTNKPMTRAGRHQAIGCIDLHNTPSDLKPQLFVLF